MNELQEMVIIIISVSTIALLILAIMFDKKKRL